jgi:hypothetical protein
VTRGDQRGSALLAAVGLLSVMLLLATMSLMAAGSDLMISTRLTRERSAFYAAESALATTIEELTETGVPLPAASLHAPWPLPPAAVRRWQDGEWGCARRVCLIPDGADADADPATTVVLFDRSFGQASSPLQHGDLPVLQVLVSVESGGARQAIVAEVAPITCAPAVPAAWTAAGPLELAGDIGVAGAAAFPALAGSSEVRLADGAHLEGEQSVDPALTLPAAVLEILNAGGTLARLDELPEADPGGRQDGVRWSRRDCAAPREGTGIFIVHNPAFDPVKYEASRVALASGVLGAGYDPGYSHLDPTRQPARLEPTVGGSFVGLIVADAVGSATAPFTLSGALVTLTRSPLAVRATAPLRIVGSPAAVLSAGRGAYRHQVGFRPVAVAAERLDRCP